MKKIIIVIGQSASGKTTFVRNNFIGKEYKNIHPTKNIYGCVSGKNFLFGHYNIGKRCEGTDTMSYSALPYIINYILKIINEYSNIILEGDRINSKKFFDFIASLGTVVDVYYFKTSIENSIRRRIEAGSKASLTFIKTTITKSENMKQYAEKLGFNIKEIIT